MVIIDTSIWARHFRVGDPELGRLLQSEAALLHPHVYTELASRTLLNRTEVLELLSALPLAACADSAEVDRLVQMRELHGRGLGFVDLHLLAAALLTPALLWSSDRRLRAAAADLRVAYPGPIAESSGAVPATAPSLR